MLLYVYINCHTNKNWILMSFTSISFQCKSYTMYLYKDYFVNDSFSVNKENNAQQKK